MTQGISTVKVSASPPHDALDFLLSEHLRHRQMCDELDRLAETTSFDAGEVTALATFIRHDLTLHLFDEETDFFPLLRQRCAPEDRVDEILGRLTREHAGERDLAAQVRVFLYTAVAESRPPAQIEGAPEALRAFAHREREHVKLENAVLIPLARQRLTPTDLADLGARFAGRRIQSTAPNG